MKLFISQRPLAAGTAVKVDGWLSAPGVPALREACEAAAAPLVLDLTDLRDADPDGVAALRQLMGSNAKVIGATPYVELLLSNSHA